MASAYCPRCREVKNMRVNIVRRSVTGPDGRPGQVKSKTLHCESCNQFVRREDEDVQQASAAA